MSAFFPSCGAPCTPDATACSGAGSCAMTVSSRSGTAVLIGMPEYTGFISTPPEYYRTRSLSGGCAGTKYSNADCTGGATNFFGNIGGSIHYNDDGSVTNATTAIGEGGIPDNGVAITAIQALRLASGFEVFGGSIVATIQSAIETDCLFRNGSGGSGCSGGILPGGGIAKEVMSDPDSEQDAIARVTGSGSVWSAYTPGIACAGIAPRTDRNVIFAMAKYRVDVIGDSLFPVRVQVQLMRRQYGSGLYQLYRTDEYSVTLGFDGKGEVEGEVPCDYGWQTCAVGCMVLPIF